MTPTTEEEFEEVGLSLFKRQFRDAAKDLCLLLGKLFITPIGLSLERSRFCRRSS